MNRADDMLTIRNNLLAQAREANDRAQACFDRPHAWKVAHLWQAKAMHLRQEAALIAHEIVTRN